MSTNIEGNIIFALTEYNESSPIKQIMVTKDSESCKEIKKAIDELEGIRQYFNAVVEPELVEYAIYREKAALTRLSYLFRIAKVKETNIIK
jgi:hypothetical protein